jgi:multiple sugar transport system permease protein
VSVTRSKAASRRGPVGAKRIALRVAAVLAVLYLLGPPAWMIISSVSSDAELQARPPHWIPHHPTLDNYATLLQLPSADPTVLSRNPQVRAFPRSFLNSFVISLGTSLFCVSFGAIAAYTISRYLKGRARRLTLLGLLASRMVPVVSVIIPIYQMLQAIHLLDTLSGLVLVYTGLLIPFVIWILEGYFRGFPAELEEAAALDGCLPVQTFFRIVLPLSTNGLFAAGAFVFISVWSDFIVGLSLTTSQAAWPLSVALAQTLNPITEPSWGLLNSAGLLAAIVPASLAFLLRRTVMRGMLSGAVKG